MCSAEKAPGPCEARFLYRSCRFVTARGLAETEYECWRILSGRYGLLRPSTTVIRYDLDLVSASPVWKVYWRSKLLLQFAWWLRLRSPLVVDILAAGDYLELALSAIKVLGFRPEEELVLTAEVSGLRCVRG